MIKNVLNKFGFARIALVASVGFPFIVASNAFAAGAPPPPPAPGAAAPAPAAEVERVIVTGSNIPTAEEVGPNPVFNLNRDLINKSGQGTTTEQLLKTQPVMSASSVPVQNNGTSQAGPAGSASISLRGFDPGATLVLLDGRRVAPFPGSANSGFAFADLTAIPVPAIQSVEILKGAGSSLYGSAAFGGVINVTTRDVPAGLHTRLRVTGGVYGDPPHPIWRFRDNPGMLGGADFAASYGTDVFGGRISLGDRHSDGYRQQDQDDHLHFAARGRWQHANTRVDFSGAWAGDRYDVLNAHGAVVAHWKAPSA